MTWVNQGNLSFIEIGQGVCIGCGVADGGQPAFVQVSYREEVRMDTLDVPLEELQAFAVGFAAQFFRLIADKCEEAGQ